MQIEPSAGSLEFLSGNAPYRQVVEGLPVAIYTCDVDGHILQYNKAAVELWGRIPIFGKDQWCGSLKMFAVDGTPIPFDQCPTAIAIKEGKIVPGREIIVERPDGRRINVVPNTQLLTNTNGRIVGAVSTLIDVTQQKGIQKAAHAEMLMSASNGNVVPLLGADVDLTDSRAVVDRIERLAAIVESSDDAIVGITMDGVVTSWNIGAYKLYGYTAQEMIGNTMQNLLPEGREMDETEILSRIKNGENVEHFETVRLTKQGEPLDISLTVSPIKDSYGMIIGASKSARNISKQKQVERLLIDGERKLQIVIDSSELGVWELNVQTKAVIYSPRYLEIIGYPGRTNLEHADLLARLHPDDMQIRNTAFEDAYRNGSLYYVSRLIWTDGSIRWIEAKGKVFYDADNKPLKLMGTIRDITKEKFYEQELERRVQQRTNELNQRNEDLVKSNIELGQFAYVASHDLQEPIRKILTFNTRILELEGEKFSAQGKDYFSRIQNASTRMKQLITDLLAYSKAGNLERNYESVDLNALVQTVVEQLKETLEAKKGRVEVENLPTITVIPYQFEQLLTNLFTNALKFSKEGVNPLIRISASVVKGRDAEVASLKDEAYHKIIVRDNGIGFDQKFSDRIFQVFQRLHGKDEYAGTGIGLSIVKKIVENHSGFITTESSAGNGAAFFIYIPVAL